MSDLDEARRQADDLRGVVARAVQNWAVGRQFEAGVPLNALLWMMLATLDKLPPDRRGEVAHELANAILQRSRAEPS